MDSPRPVLPLDLPRLVMRRALFVALGGLLLALALGLLRMRFDTGQEMEGALGLARAAQALAALDAEALAGADAASDAQALARLTALGELRHLRLEVRDADGRLLWRSADSATPAPAGATPVSWLLHRPRGRPWQVTLVPRPESEQREALFNLAGLVGIMALCCAAMLAVMHRNVRSAFRPLQTILAAIARVEHQDLEALKRLPAMPTRELASIAAALEHLAGALEAAESARRVLSQKMLTLEEDERQRLARDLHDEFGQRLTALRVDAAWLARRLDGQPEVHAVLAGMAEQCSRIQRDVREMLTRLQPLGVADSGPGGDRSVPLARLHGLLEGLVAAWQAPGSARGHAIELLWLQGPASAADPRAMAGLEARTVPRALLLAVYRISQEALTNAARHAGARHVRLAVSVDPQAAMLHWSVRDDGSGLAHGDAAFAHGNGLAGMRQRVWALGGEFAWSDAADAAPCGLHLRAAIPLPPAPEQPA